MVLLFGESEWTSIGENGWTSFGENTWPPIGESTWTSIARKMTEALGTIEPTDRLERKLACRLLHLYKRRLRGIVEAVPTWPVTGDTEHEGTRCFDFYPEWQYTMCV